MEKKSDIADEEGVRVSLFVSGCEPMKPSNQAVLKSLTLKLHLKVIR